MLVLGKKFENPVDRLDRAARVQRREHEVAGLGRLDARFHRFPVPYFPEQDDMRRLAQDFLETGLIRKRVPPDLLLRDQRGRGNPAPGRVRVVHQGVVPVFDRILDRDNVPGKVAAHIVQNGREGGRFARPGRTGDQAQPETPLHQLAQAVGDHGVDAQRFEPGNVGAQHAAGDPEAAFAEMDLDAHAHRRAEGSRIAAEVGHSPAVQRRPELL